MSYSAEFRKKYARDPVSYPLEWLVRNLLLNHFSGQSVNPVGPKTRAHTLRMQAAQQDAELDALDIQDDQK
jgi:hypothetical protein